MNEEETLMYRAITVICLLAAIGAALHYRQQARTWRLLARQRAGELHRLGNREIVPLDLTTRVTDLRPGMVITRVPIIGRFEPGRIVETHGEHASGTVAAVAAGSRGGTPRMIRFIGGERVYVADDALATIRIRGL